jgi:hypothetical protein
MAKPQPRRAKKGTLNPQQGGPNENKIGIHTRNRRFCPAFAKHGSHRRNDRYPDTLFVIAAQVSAFIVSLKRPWARIVVRVAGSWMAAIGMLMFGWMMRG